MTNIQGNYKIKELTDAQLEDDLNDIHLSIDLKNMVVAELNRRRSQELCDKLKDLSQKIGEFGEESSRLSNANFLLSIAVFFIAWMQLITQIFDSGQAESLKWSIFAIVTVGLFFVVWYFAKKIIGKPKK